MPLIVFIGLNPANSVPSLLLFYAVGGRFEFSPGRNYPASLIVSQKISLGVKILGKQYSVDKIIHGEGRIKEILGQTRHYDFQSGIMKTKKYVYVDKAVPS